MRFSIFLWCFLLQKNRFSMLKMKIPKMPKMPKMPKIPTKILTAMGSYRNFGSKLKGISLQFFIKYKKNVFWISEEDLESEAQNPIVRCMEVPFFFVFFVNLCFISNPFLLAAKFEVANQKRAPISKKQMTKSLE